jgi:two-component system, NtrC family, response regulator HydG
MSRILIADDEDVIRRFLVRGLMSAGHEVEEASNGNAAIERLHANAFDIVLTDLKMAGSTGLDVLRTAHALQPTTAVIVMSGFGSVKSTADAFKSGAFDFVEKPFAIQDIESRIATALEMKRSKLAPVEPRHAPQGPADFTHIVGSSAALRRVVGIAQKVASSNATVLILGESGTGKELLASSIHHDSPRVGGNMVKVNCAALQEGLLESELFGHERGAFTGAERQRIGRFELADGGTLFLDEIGDMAASTQAKILRVLQEGEFQRLGGTRTLVADVRLIVATNRNLFAMVESGRFREDLYYRLNVIAIEMPPLRQRQEDIVPLATTFIRRFSGMMKKKIDGLDAKAEKRLQRHHWPGNIRELANTIERAVLLTTGHTITEGDLGFEAVSAPPPGSRGPDRASVVKIPAGGVPLEDVERDALVEALNMTNWVRKDAAKLLSITNRVINYKIQMLQIECPDRRRSLRDVGPASDLTGRLRRMTNDQWKIGGRALKQMSGVTDRGDAGPSTADPA